MKAGMAPATLGAIMAMLILAAVAQGAGEDAGRFDSGLAAAKKSLETPEGAAYDQAFGSAMQSQLGIQMAKCFTRTPDPDLTRFDMLVRLDATGKAGEVLMRPETNVALCFKPRIGEAVFPAPPRPDYWVHVEMEVTR